MCQLLGMNCNVPTDILFSFAGFRKRGGLTDHHEDGFGIAFFEDKGVRIYHDDKPCHLSAVADLIDSYPIKSLNVISHIRLATEGKTSLVNTHPFVRELWGQYWVFAHNGQIDVPNQPNQPRYQAVGSTDSERAFCFLLNQLDAQFQSKPDDDVLFGALQKICSQLGQYGLFNCLLSNGDWHLAYANTLLHYLTRRAPFGEAQLVDKDSSIDFTGETQENDIVTVFTTIPLTNNESWQQLAIGECLIFRDGLPVFSYRPETSKYMSIEEGLKKARAAGLARSISSISGE